MPARKSSSRSRKSPVGDGIASLAEQLTKGVLRPLGLVVLSRERIQQALDEAADRGRLTRSDANDLVIELMGRGRQQTEEVLSDLDRLLGAGRQSIETATRRARQSESVDRLVAGADRARRTMGVGSAFPITSYDELTAPQVRRRLNGLNPDELRMVRDFERRHANRKTVLAAVDKALS